MSDTPETDKLLHIHEHTILLSEQRYALTVEHARTLERQRDELARHLKNVLSVAMPLTRNNVSAVVAARVYLKQIGADKSARLRNGGSRGREK